MTFQRGSQFNMHNVVHNLVHNLKSGLTLLLSSAVITVLFIVLGQFFQFGNAQVLYMPASEYDNANLNYTPEVYNYSPEHVFDEFPVFESIRDLINRNQHDTSLSQPIGRLNLFLRRVDGAEGTSFCTASLISERHIITNYHCIPGNDKNVRVERATLRLGYLSEREVGEEFKVKMRAIETNQKLDYSILELSDVPDSRYGKIDLSAVRDPNPLENLYIIHHPGGKPKAITRERCYMHPSWDLVSSSEIYHKCDTEAGSSGAIVFTDSGQPVGIHWGGYDETLPLEARYNVAKKLTTIIQGSNTLRKLTGATTASAISVARGTLKLSSSPNGAEVYLNGEFIGNTPLQAEIPEGNYQAKLKLQGHQDFAANVVMRGNSETAGALRLTPANNNYLASAGQHVPQALVMPEGLQDFLVDDPYTTFATRPATSTTPVSSPFTLPVVTPPVGTNTSSQNSGVTNTTIMVHGAQPVNPNVVYGPSVPSVNTEPASEYVTVSTTTTDGSPTSSFTSSAAVNPNLTSTLYAQSPNAQTPIDIDPINPTQAGDDTVGLNDLTNPSIVPYGARWHVVGRGESANMERMGFVIVHDASTLFKVWARAYGNVSVVPALPSIDFERETVVGLFLGIQPAGNLNLQINNVLVKPDLVHVYVKLADPTANNGISQGYISPWILVRVPKASVDTVLFYDDNTASLLGIAKKQ